MNRDIHFIVNDASFMHYENALMFAQRRAEQTGHPQLLKTNEKQLVMIVEPPHNVATVITCLPAGV